MDYVDFYDIATRLNEINHNTFTQREIACNAYEYMCDYEYSKARFKPNHTMIALCELLVEDMDWQDYEGLENTLDIKTMEKILREYMEEM